MSNQITVPPSPRQNDTRFFSTHFLVKVYSSLHGSVTARVPETLALQLTADWDTPLSSSNPGFLDVALQEIKSLATKTQLASAQVWSGSAPIEITLPLEFYADKNPKLEVINPIVLLAKMALPSATNLAEHGLFTPPGPRIFNVGGGANDQISIEIGNFMLFTKVIVINVNPTFTTRDMSKSGYPLRATCEVTFRSMFSLTGPEFAGMFRDIK